MCVCLPAGPHEGAVAASAEGATQVSAVPFLRLRRADDNEGSGRSQGLGERGVITLYILFKCYVTLFYQEI